MIHASIRYYIFCWTLSRGLEAAAFTGELPAGSMRAQGTHDAGEDRYTGSSGPHHLPWLLSPEFLSIPADQVLTDVAAPVQRRSAAWHRHPRSSCWVLTAPPPAPCQSILVAAGSPSAA